MLKKVALWGLLVLIVSAFLATVFSWAEESSLKTDKFKVKGMCCENCAKKISAMLSELPGVDKAEVNFEKKVALVTYDKNKIEKGEIKEALSEHNSSKKESEKESAQKHKSCWAKDGSHSKDCPMKKEGCMKMGTSEKEGNPTETKEKECPHHQTK